MPIREPIRTIAIDWSGDRRNSRRKIWLAEATREELVRLENGRGREEIAQGLIEEATHDPRLVIGFDFAFSFPRRFCEQIGAHSAVDVWKQAAVNGEHWLSSCHLPFWGRPGIRCPETGARFRMTELECAAGRPGIHPKSIFQIGGAGAVGTGSIRGMPILNRLHEAGFSIWPFDPPGWPAVVEIYPRALTGPVNKSSREARESYLHTAFPELSGQFLRAAASCEDAFDAAVSALVMHRRSDEFATLTQAADHGELLEGRIWY